MFACTPATRIFVALDPVDLRRSFNGLSAWVQQRMAEDPLSGNLYLFTNRQRNRLKILVWDGSGLWCCAKRLERGRFGWPTGAGPHTLLRAEELSALLGGLEVRERPGWYRR
jgi:transposase